MAPRPADRVEAPRTFKRRGGRIRPGQSAALTSLWPRYGLDSGTGRLDLAAVFGREAPVVLEIGFGMGETTLALATADPGRDVLAVDVHAPGAGALLRGMEAAGVGWVRVMLADALIVLREDLAPGSLAEVRLFSRTRGRRRATTSGGSSPRHSPRSWPRGWSRTGGCTPPPTGPTTPPRWYA